MLKDKFYGLVFGMAFGDANKKNDLNQRKHYYTDNTAIFLSVCETIIKSDVVNNAMIIENIKALYLNKKHRCASKISNDILKPNLSFALHHGTQLNVNNYSQDSAVIYRAIIPTFLNKFINNNIILNNTNKYEILKTIINLTHQMPIIINSIIGIISVLTYIFDGYNKQAIINYIHKNYYSPFILDLDYIGTSDIYECTRCAYKTFINTESFEEGLLMINNMEIVELNAVSTLYGLLAGAFYGFKHINKSMPINKLDNYKNVISIIDECYSYVNEADDTNINK